jgi:hypothetical protein
MNVPTRRTAIKLALAVPAVTALASCAHVETENKVDVRPIEVKPIHITVDVNVRVDRELDNFFAFEDQATTTKPATQPATAPAPVPPAAAASTQTGA